MTSRRRRYTVAAAATAFLLGACLAAATARAANGNESLYGDEDEFSSRKSVAALIGARLLDSSDWEPVDVQPTAGIDVTYAPVQWQVALCGSLLYSSSSGTANGIDVSASILELQLGVRKTWRPTARLRPYAGGGGSVLWLSYKVDGWTLPGTGGSTNAGFWLGGGAYVALGRGWQVGADARWSRVEADIEGTKANAGGLQVFATAGYHWSQW